MKHLLPKLLLPVLLVAVPAASASTYKGKWKNKTFDTTGPLTVVLNITKAKISGKFDADGPVFGLGDPPAFKFNAKRNANGTANFVVEDTGLGDITGTFKANGKLTFLITNIPAGFTEVRINGKANLDLETFTATYEIDDANGIFANGVANAHVHKAPILTSKKIVKTAKAKATTKIVVESASNIKFTNAIASKGASAKITGKAPYKLVVTKLKKGKTTPIKVVFKNGDGKKATKTIKFKRS